MSKQVSINIRMDSEIKNSAETLFNQMGLNMSVAVNAFIMQCLREEAIPFTIKPYDIKAIKNKEYLDKLDKSIKQGEDGEVISYTLDSLKSFIE
ncbi:MAG: type II toxin-antitoxin system RelB/DinJ family antitoxin [Defluviitaleaceae bacterium]|nr:type II toxin-antitoxin system RelB/DinJ family antitoxin [Defluviitaleaceae bacterium]